MVLSKLIDNTPDVIVILVIKPCKSKTGYEHIKCNIIKCISENYKLKYIDKFIEKHNSVNEKISKVRTWYFLERYLQKDHNNNMCFGDIRTIQE